MGHTERDIQTGDRFAINRPKSRMAVVYNPVSAVDLAKARRRKQSKRTAIVVSAIGAVGIASAALGIGYAAGKIDVGASYQRVMEKGQTDDQRKAQEILSSETLSGTHLVHDIQIAGEDVSGEMHAYLRNQPAAPNALDEIGGGDNIADAQIGETIPVALVVVGNNPDRTKVMDEKKDKWVAYFDEKTKKLVFLSVNELDLASRVKVVETDAIDLSK